MSYQVANLCGLRDCEIPSSVKFGPGVPRLASNAQFPNITSLQFDDVCIYDYQHFRKQLNL